MTNKEYESKIITLENVIMYKDDEIDELKKEVSQLQKLYMKLLLKIENDEGSVQYRDLDYYLLCLFTSTVLRIII